MDNFGREERDDWGGRTRTGPYVRPLRGVTVRVAGTRFALLSGMVLHGAVPLGQSWSRKE